MSCTCIIPFFNEYDRILKVLDEVLKVKLIDEIILVDDGSTDSTTEIVKKHYPSLKILNNLRNLGKTGAIKIGLQQAKGDYILLLDADLRNLNYNEIEAAITKIRDGRGIDMIVLRRINAPFFIKLVRGDILVSGERILKKEDLKK
ncbi:MAG: glycosyltransferase family 2 protein, partial [Candidatus Blackburnbacteria bacterium]|nr:glycosyltransferase family 2 protein [Candidatus Blackburnbacteria bacterium]